MNDTVHAARTAPGAIARAESPLIATHFGLAIDDLLATIRLTQQYVNREDRAIEVAYTIALPTGAVLLDVEAEIGELRLRGRVQEKVVAEMRYEQALAEGHSAFAIRWVDDHLLNIALGNLKPGESLTLRIVLAQWLTWNGDRVRLTLPTTIAPRYGASTLQPADKPVVDLLAEHGFRLDGQVRGLLAGAQLGSATHRLAVRAVEHGVDFSIERGLLDRDIVIDLRDATQSTCVAGRIDADLAGRDAAMIAFCAQADLNTLRPVVAELVVDCSGSMGGVSIEQTRAAVRAIVAELRPVDRVNVLRFGSTQQHLLRRPQPATVPVQHTMLQAADELQADLGGTELLAALNAGLDDLARLPADVGGERVLFIISDGEVWNLDSSEFLRRCERDRVRVFAVAVGSAAVETTFAPLTRATGGALERVLPGDAMAERIQRHFARVRTGALRELRVRWPAAPAWTHGPSEVYPGDGVILSAGLDVAADVNFADVSWIDAAGMAQQLRVPLRRLGADATAPSTLARMLAQQRLSGVADVAAATRLAIDYQLVTEHSAIALVLQRAAGEQLDRLPELRVVPQMLAVGWGGTTDSGKIACATPAGGDDFLDMPAFLSRDACPGALAPPAPAARTKASPLRRALAAMSSVLLADNGRGGNADAVAASPQADLDSNRRTELIGLLVARLCGQPEMVAAIKRGEVGLARLALRLPPALFNWLDEQAERQGRDLESGDFWRQLIGQLCVGAEGAELRRLFGD